MAEVITMPKLGFDMAEGTLIRWVVLEGENVTKGAILAEIETDKATVEVESAYDGVVARHLVNEGDIVPVNMPIAVVGAENEEIDFDALLGEQEEAEVPDQEIQSTDRTPMPSPVESKDGKDGEGEGVTLPGGVRASPLARRFADEHNINLKLVEGSGKLGRITKKDVEAFLEMEKVAPPEDKPSVPVATPAAPSFTPLEPAPSDKTVPLNRLRSAIGRRMTESKQTVPHFYVTSEYNVQALMNLRGQVNSLLQENEKISVNDFIIKAAALALRSFPNLNASLKGNEILLHGQVNIGVAVAVEGGLLTVVCRDTDRKPLRQIASEVRVMAERARSGKVKPNDIEGSTFSVSNLGMFDVEHFIAIINPPEAAILAIGAVQKVPVVEDGELIPGMRMKATISVDHRVSDGAEAARFMQVLRTYLEEPLRLLV